MGLAGAGAAQDALEAARDAVAKFNLERSALNNLLAGGIQTPEQQQAVQNHELAAKQHLRDAREAFRAAGLPDRATLAVLREYIEVLRLLGDFDLAAEALERAIALAPKDGLLRVELGESLGQIGPARHPEAFDALREALTFELTAPYSARAWFQMGRIYFDEGLYEFAREAFRKVLEFQPEAIRTKIHLAALDAREGKIAEASTALDALGREAIPFDVETRMLLRRALAEFDAARRYIPDTAEAHLAYAKLLYRAARIQEAIGAAERSAKLAPENYETHNFIGAIYMQISNARGARDAFEKSLAINPDQPNVRSSLATIPPEELAPTQQPAPIGVPFKMPPQEPPQASESPQGPDG